MAELSQADRYLLEQIRRGSDEGWAQLVDRYQGRLLAFARGKLRDRSEAEDIVQETFLSFLQGLGRYQGQASIETYLFVILRRKIVNWMRGRWTNVCSIQDAFGGQDDSAAGDPGGQIPAADATASWYARREEDHDRQRAALAAAICEAVEHFKESLDFRELEIVEMALYCQLRNRDVARLAEVDEKHVALVKHRFIKQVQKRLGGASLDAGDSGLHDALLSEVWQEQRPSCPKRSTVGAYLLGTLDPAWREYVAFHLERLGCTFCRANLEDLQRQSRDESHERTFRQRIMESTVGFLHR